MYCHSHSGTAVAQLHGAYGLLNKNKNKRNLQTTGFSFNCYTEAFFKCGGYLSFLPRDAMRKRGLCCQPVFVHPSVCYTFVHCIQMAEDIVKLLSRPSSAMILVL